jgi:thymidylate synthase ThyX
MIEARIIADSLSPAGTRLPTFVCVYPRFIHSEVMTHRVFSRNAASSRAIPVQKMIERILAEPAMPVSWGKNQKGMQANEDVCPEVAAQAVGVWNDAMKDAVKHAQRLVALGIHKQIANRVVEPYAHMTTVITATEFENFFALRADPEAQPEFQVLAYEMLQAYLASEPRKLAAGEWHLPFADKYVGDGLTLTQLLKISTARCARVSYLNFEGDFAYEKDYKVHDNLLASGHMSPFEHAAVAEREMVRSGNFVGFTQYRKMIVGENRQLSRKEMMGRLATRRGAA